MPRLGAFDKLNERALLVRVELLIDPSAFIDMRIIARAASRSPLSFERLSSPSSAMAHPRPAEHRPAPPPRSAWQAMVGACAKTLSRAKPSNASLSPIERLDLDLARCVRHHDSAEFHRLLVDGMSHLPTPRPDGLFLELPKALAAAFDLLKRPSLDYARALLSAGANPNAKLPSRAAIPLPSAPEGERALHLAASAGREDAIELLLRAGADINAIDAYRRTPLFIAAGLPSSACLRALLAAKPRLEAQSESGATALNASLRLFPVDDPAFRSNFFTPADSQAFLAPLQQKAANAPLLLEAGANPNGGRHLGGPMPGQLPPVAPLTAAIRLRDELLAKRLVELGADASVLEPIDHDKPGFDQHYLSVVAQRLPEIRLALDSVRQYARALAQDKADRAQRAAAEAAAQTPAAPPEPLPPAPAEPLARKILSRRDTAPAGATPPANIKIPPAP